VGGKRRERWVEGRGRRGGGKEKGSGLRALGRFWSLKHERNCTHWK